MQFIEVELSDDRGIMAINMDRIDSIRYNKKDNETIISLNNTGCWIAIKEDYGHLMGRIAEGNVKIIL